MEVSLRILKNELASLETMLDDATFFRNEARQNLLLTEKEASENRRHRRVQMAKMKKAVEKILEENQRVPANNKLAHGGGGKVNRSETLQVLNPALRNDISEILRVKRMEVDEFKTRGRRLVDAMRVPDITYIPTRLRVVARVGVRLQEEMLAKEKLRDLFLKQKAQLQLILYYFRYTGVAKQEEFTKLKEQYESSIEEAKKKNALMTRRLDRLGDVQVQLRLGMLSIFEQLTEGKKKISHKPHEDLRENLKNICHKLKKMVEANTELEAGFGDIEPERNYVSYVKPPFFPNRLIRVGNPPLSEDSEEDDDLVDSKVPSRAEIKMKSARFLTQANLKRGIRK